MPQVGLSVRTVFLLSIGSVTAGCGSDGSSPNSDSTPSDGGGGHPRSSADAAEATDSSEGGGTPTGDDATIDVAEGASEGGDAALAVNPHPTVSSWLGTNISGDLPRVDVTYQLVPFNTPAAQLDANGYPQAGASGTSSTDLGFVLPSGTYKISYRGTGTLAVSGIGKRSGAWQAVNGEQRNMVQIGGTPGAFGNFLTLTITNGAGQTVDGIHLYFPGFDYDSTTTFLPQFISLLGPFRAMRFMDWEATNNSTLANWADRPAASHFGASKFGEPYEHIAELVNVTGKDAWITIPENATADFIAQFAQFMTTHLDFSRIAAARASAGFTTPFRLIVENSNETWNGGFSAKATFLAAANKNTALYTGKFTGTFGPTWQSNDTNLMRVAQYEADRLVEIGNAFRTAFGAIGQASAISPVLSGWAIGQAYSDEGLTFIQKNYGDPTKYVTYVAQAPYFGTADDTTTGSLSTLFPAMQTNIASMDATFQEFVKLGAQYGVGIVAYEGGQGLSGTTNQTIKHLAQHDERMYEAYKAYLALWKKDFGPSLFMNFSLAGIPGLPEMTYQYGFWGSIIGITEDTATCKANLPTLTGTETVASVSHHCPKYAALAEQVP